MRKRNNPDVLVTFEKEKDKNKVKSKNKTDSLTQYFGQGGGRKFGASFENLWQLLRSRLDFEEQT